jgi:hypothetical protein
MSQRAYREGQLAALVKLGFASPQRALAAHAAAGGALGGLGGYAMSDEHPLAATLGGAVGGAATGYGIKRILNNSRLNQSRNLQNAANDAFTQYHTTATTPGLADPANVEVLSDLYDAAQRNADVAHAHMINKERGWF